MPTIVQTADLFGSGHSVARSTALLGGTPRPLTWDGVFLFWGEHQLIWGQVALVEQQTDMVSAGLSFTRATQIT